LLLFTLIASTNVTFDQATAVGYVAPYW